MREVKKSRNYSILADKAVDRSLKEQMELIFRFVHSHKKRKDSLEGSLNRVLLASELEFSKIIIPRLS